MDCHGSDSKMRANGRNVIALESIEPTDQLRRLRTAQGEVVVGSQMAHQIHVVAPEPNGA